MAISMSHVEFKEAAQNIIQKMMKIDTILEDLHPQITSSEVNALVQLEHGQALKIYIHRDIGSPWKIIIPKDSTLRHLKLALKTKVKLIQGRQKVSNTISWKYIWKMHWLVYQSTKLTDDHKKLVDYGITNKSNLSFTKKVESKKSDS